MKRIIAYFAMAMALTACGSDEALQEYEHQQDKYPLQFTATVEDGTETRVTADNKWSNGDEIGIQIGISEDQQGKYTYVANDGGGTWSSENPVSWQEGQTADVTAWYPYGIENADISNQAGGYTQYELLKAVATRQSSQQTVNLTFKHQMAKVQCRVMDNNSRLIRGAKVRFYGMPSVTFNKGEVTATGTRGAITPYSIDEGSYTTYVALLAPQTIASGESFIEVTANGKTYRFKPADNIELQAGKSHNYKIKIGDKIDYAIDDNGIYHVCTAEGLNKWAEAANASPYNASCILENHIPMTGENNWIPVCQNHVNGFTGTFDGNGKSISGLNFDISTNFTTTAVGFIGNLGTGGEVKNLTMKDAKIFSTGTNVNVGAVAGYNCGLISNCDVIKTTISGKNQAGGVVGSNWGKISYCHVSNDCSVKVESNVYLGGIAGFNASSGSITACYALCRLDATVNVRVGGIFGSSAGSCTACYSRCTLLNAPSKAGGISGNNPGTVTACYWANVPDATYKFEKSIGDGTDITAEVDGTDGNTWAVAMEGMNSALTQAGYTDYQYKANGSSQTEPLKLVENQQQRPAATR